MNKTNTSKTMKALRTFLVFSLMLPIGALASGPTTVDLASASIFSILSKAGISTTGSTLVVGDIGVSPITSTAITGFSLNLPTESPFSTSPIVSGKVYASDYTDPTPSKMTTAISDMQTAYTDGFGRINPDTTELGAGDIGGKIFIPLLYHKKQ